MIKSVENSSRANLRTLLVILTETELRLTGGMFWGQHGVFFFLQFAENCDSNMGNGVYFDHWMLFLKAAI